jgi:hypothetical protein
MSGVWRLAYGRPADRSDWLAVLEEGRGACSGKHALLAALALENDIPVDLVLVVYEMSERNTPGVGATLAAHGLDAVPEAHCCLLAGGEVLDVTFPDAIRRALPTPLLHRETIRPDDIGDYKTAVHRRVLAEWARARQPSLTVVEIWDAREACIAALLTVTV